ncbi:anthranilate phosphoribosyltransferase [Haliangium sp.]|uniref:anthranilate phosphoribosyltransferase n=1 Tax=Haliangium sp. TaxID=2663208 RepID=UPI003D0C51CE
MSHEAFHDRSEAERLMSSYLGRVATGPTLSKDLSRAEARDGMARILAGEVDPIQAAVFLIALRMKRETHDELCGVLDALRAATCMARAEVDDLVDMAEPYNGYVRHLPVGAFVPAVLAACGVPCVIHGCRASGPKWGLTAHRVLEAAGVEVGTEPAAAAARVGRAGWAYVDLARFCPGLHGLAELRRLIVKRPCLALLEKLLAPIQPRAGGRMHLWVGFAHREYPEILERLARGFGYASMLAVRGIEGGVTTTLSGRARAVGYLGEGALAEHSIDARATLGTSADERAPALPPGDDPDPGAGAGPPSPAQVERWAMAAAAAGRAALDGQPGPSADLLALSAAAMLHHLGRVSDLAAGAARARATLTDGSARARFEAE